MIFQKNEIFSLNNFEGPLEFLLHLIQREEIHIHDISLHELTHQCLIKFKEWNNNKIDLGAEFIGNTAYLLWFKSKTLLPVHQKEEDPLPKEIEEDPNFEIIYNLLDYCRFKDAAKELTRRHEQQNSCFFRGMTDIPEWKKPMGINHISLDELSELFKEMMTRASETRPQIHEENWRVSDKIHFICHLIKERQEINMDSLFTPEKSRLEWIVIFLAILELIKRGDIGVGRNTHTQTIILFSKQKITAS